MCCFANDASFLMRQLRGKEETRAVSGLLKVTQHVSNRANHINLEMVIWGFFFFFFWPFHQTLAVLLFIMLPYWGIMVK